MFIEYIDLLRCPAGHDDTQLVAAFFDLSERFVREARLGCPVCGASYVVTDGVADFRAESLSDPASVPASGTIAPAASKGDSRDDALRIAAMLGLSRPGSLVILDSSFEALAHEIATLTESRVMVINPSEPVGDSEDVGVVRAPARIPLAGTSADAVATSRIGEGARILKPGGRLVAPAATPTLEGSFGLRELARDESYVVAELVSPLVPLSSRPRTSRR